MTGCADNNPPKGPEVAAKLKGRALPAELGVVTSGYCRHDAGGSAYNCVLRTTKGRVACTAARVDSDGHTKRLYCRTLGP